MEKRLSLRKNLKEAERRQVSVTTSVQQLVVDAWKLQKNELKNKAAVEKTEGKKKIKRTWSTQRRRIFCRSKVEVEEGSTSELEEEVDVVVRSGRRGRR